MTIALLMLAVLAAPLNRGADNLEDILAKMDQAASRFTGLSAQISKTTATVVINEKTTESGGFFIQKDKKGYKVMTELREPEKTSILVKGDKVSVYHPSINQEEEYRIGSHRELLDSLLLLGFGGGGHDLLKSYTVTLGASDDRNVKLDLIPKGSLVKDITKVELWLSPDTWAPARQRFTQPTKDYVDVVYTAVVLGPQADSKFEQKMNSKTKHVQPGR